MQLCVDAQLKDPASWACLLLPEITGCKAGKESLQNQTDVSELLAKENLGALTMTR